LKSRGDKVLDKDLSLPISSYVILGLVVLYGPCTPYDLKKMVDESIGYFWDFPRAQLYIDPERLVVLGLLNEKREEAGRRRKWYHITDHGRQIIDKWLADTTPIEVELRDTGLLKLYFGSLTDRSTLITQAKSQAAMHRKRLADYQEIVENIANEKESNYALAALRMGIRYEEMSISYWEEITTEYSLQDREQKE
jgi:PadR family transcriptional regulator AphA